MQQFNVNTELFNKSFRKLLTKKQRNIWLYGGSSSGKSYFIAHWLVIRVLGGEAVLIARETQVSLRKSVWLEMTNAIIDLDLERFFKFNKTELTISCTESVGSIQMVGCDDESKVRSIRPPRQRAYSVLWLEEADGIPKSFLVQLNLRMRGEPYGGFSKQTISSLNPTYEQHYIFQEYLYPMGWDAINDWYFEDEKNIIMRTTYRDNDHLAQDEIDYLESLKDVSEYHHKVYLLAEPGILGDRIFDNITYCDMNDVPDYLPLFCGLDIGYTDDTAFSMMRVDEVEKKIYIFDGFSKDKLDHIQMAGRIKLLFEKNNCSVLSPIFADSEDPRIINQLKKEGLNCRPASKPAGSVLNGLMIMNAFELVIVKSFKPAVDSFKNYVWKTDKKTGKAIDEPDHTHSHVPDSCRYGLEIVLKGFQRTLGKHIKF